MFVKLLILANTAQYIANKPPDESCNMIGGVLIDNSCIYNTINKCISYNHIDYDHKNCSYNNYQLMNCIPKKRSIYLWCNNYPLCISDSDCILNKYCIQNRCIFNNKQPYCILLSDDTSKIVCD